MKFKITKFGGIVSQAVQGIDMLREKLGELTEHESEVEKAVIWAEAHGNGDEYEGDYFNILITEQTAYYRATHDHAPNFPDVLYAIHYSGSSGEIPFMPRTFVKITEREWLQNTDDLERRNITQPSECY